MCDEGHVMRLRLLILSALVTALLAGTGLTSSASAAPTWAPAETAAIHPGTQTFTAGGQCTANFVFTDAADNVYIGQAAHCSGTGGQTETNGCDAGTLPVGTEVEVDGASQPGVMVYNSWATMQAVGENDADTCQYNDFALIALHPSDFDDVNPSIPVWGGPVGTSDGTDPLDEVYSFGNSSLRQGIEALSPKYGLSLGTISSGWSTPLYTITPGIPGDSGSPFLDSEGRALGVLSTLALAPLVASNNVSSIGLAVDYMRSHDGPQVTLAHGTEPFTGGPGGLVTGLLGGGGLLG
jgi:hypothetical protein